MEWGYVHMALGHGLFDMVGPCMQSALAAVHSCKAPVARRHSQCMRHDKALSLTHSGSCVWDAHGECQRRQTWMWRYCTCESVGTHSLCFGHLPVVRWCCWGPSMCEWCGQHFITPWTFAVLLVFSLCVSGGVVLVCIAAWASHALLLYVSLFAMWYSWLGPLLCLGLKCLASRGGQRCECLNPGVERAVRRCPPPHAHALACCPACRCTSAAAGVLACAGLSKRMPGPLSVMPTC